MNFMGHFTLPANKFSVTCPTLYIYIFIWDWNFSRHLHRTRENSVCVEMFVFFVYFVLSMFRDVPFIFSECEVSTLPFSPLLPYPIQSVRPSVHPSPHLSSSSGWDWCQLFPLVAYSCHLHFPLSSKRLLVFRLHSLPVQPCYKEPAEAGSKEGGKEK